MKCRLCQTGGSHITPADRRCAFDDKGVFQSSNLHCGTMAALLGIANFKTPTDDDWYSATLGHDGLFIVLFWQGAGAWVNVATTYAPGVDLNGELSLRLAEEIIAEAAGKGARG